MATRRRLFLMLAATAALVACGAAANYLLNPYGAWRIALVDPIFRKVSQERVTTPYLLRTAAPQTLLLGSSRVLRGMRIDQGERDGMMNGALNGATIRQLSQIIAAAIANPRLKRIVWGVDFYAFDQRWDRDRPDFDARMNHSVAVQVEDTLLSFDALVDGVDGLRRAMRGVAKLHPTQTAALPWPMPLVCSTLDEVMAGGLAKTPDAVIEAQTGNVVGHYQGFRYSPQLFDMFRGAIESARGRGIEIVLFVPPMSRYELELIRQTGNWQNLLDWKRRLVTVAPFWDFSGYNSIGSADAGFIDVMHFKPPVGQLILRRMLGEPTDPCNGLAEEVASSAIHVDPANIESEIEKQEQMRGTATRTESRYARLTALVLARREGPSSATDEAAAGDEFNEPRGTAKASPQ